MAGSIPLRKIPGSRAINLKWLMQTGIKTATQARSVASTFVEEFRKTKEEVERMAAKK
jgi:hypothetical protein